MGDDRLREIQQQFRRDSHTQLDDTRDDEDEYMLDTSTRPGSRTNSDNANITPSINMSNVLGSVIRSQSSPKIDSDIDKPSRFDLASRLGAMFVTPKVAQRLLDGWIKHLSTQYPVIHTPCLRELHTRRDETPNVFEESMLHLVYANSGRILEAIGDNGMFFAERHYEAALQNMDAVLAFQDMRSITYIFLLALYCLRGPRDPGAWTLAGLAVR